LTVHQPIVETQPIAADAVVQYWVEQSSAAGAPAAVARACAAFKAAGMSAVAFHLGPRGLAARWDALAGIAADHGLAAVAASGVDGASLGARGKGRLLGAVLARPSCRALLVDAEGQYDTDTGPADETDAGGALALGEEIRALSSKPVGDQCWFAIQSHGDGRPRDPANPFGGFPADEFAQSCVNWGRFRQLYCNNMRGASRYARTREWMHRDWLQFDDDLRRAGRADLVRPLGLTLQGYGWRDIVPDLVDALLEQTVGRGLPVFLWAEPTPAPETLACVRAVHKLRAEGFANVGRSPADAVRAYQAAFNATAPSDRQLTADGRCGPHTLASMGLALA
jgi:hypothetical protein